MSVLLSVFYMYFLALITVLYPVLVGIFMRYRRARLSRRRRAAAIASGPAQAGLASHS
jgi:hypothetical protein